MSLNKSRIWFSPNTSRGLKQQVVGIFGIPPTDHIGIYLRTPIFTTRRIANSYQYLVDKILMKIEGQQAKYLSMVGQATLVKSSMASIPLYAMQTMLLPQKISHHLDQLSCKFLWGDTTQRRGCHTVNWDMITLPKEAKGLGISFIRYQNKAILMNQAQRLNNNTHMLWAQVLKTKYFPHTSLFTSSRNPRGSYIWKALFVGIQFLKEGMKWIVRVKHTIQIWTDPWLPRGTFRSYIEGSLLLHDETRHVSSLRTNHACHFDSLHVPLPSQLKNLIKGIPVAYIARISNTLIWP